MTISNDLSLLLESYRYELQYVDYSEDEWTVPVILTEKRASQIINDNAIRRVRFTPILGDADTFTFEHSALTMTQKPTH